MKDKDIAALIESLCERPLSDPQTGHSAEFLALCREATTLLLQDSDAKADEAADTDRITEALAELLSRGDAQAARHLIETAAAKSAAVRLDVQSARAFVDAVEQSLQSAPVHLVDELLAGDPERSTRAATPGARAEPGTIWSRLVERTWLAQPWRLAAACTVMLTAGVASWSVYRQQTDLLVEDRAPLPAAVARSAPAVKARPTPPTPALATAQPCQPRAAESEARTAARSEPVSVEKLAPSGETGCVTPPRHQLADRPADEIEAIAARARLDAARQAAAERAAAEAASKAGAAPAGHGQRPVAAEHFGPPNGRPGRDIPAAASTVPTTPSQYGIAPPAAAPAARPYPAGR